MDSLVRQHVNFMAKHMVIEVACGNTSDIITLRKQTLDPLIAATVTNGMQ